MANYGIISFEVLAQPVVPGVPNVPYVQQGSFVQITNINGQAFTVSLTYFPSPRFVPTSGAVALFANYIDNTGNVTQVPATTFITQRGFQNVSIPSLGAFIFGVQYIIKPTSATQLAGTTPQDGVAARGVLSVAASADMRISPLPTIRQVFTNYSSTGAVLNTSEAAYAVPFETLGAALEIDIEV
ncbi:hypothetical protein [Acidisoma sp. 7E03]